MASLPHAPALALPAERAAPVVSRRPVLDRTLRTVGFELVFEDGGAGTESWRGELNCEHHPAYLSVTADWLLEHQPLPLDPAGVVLELAAVPSVEGRLLDRLAGLRREGFRIVLDELGLVAEDVLAVDPSANVRTSLPRRCSTLGERLVLSQGHDVELDDVGAGDQRVERRG